MKYARVHRSICRVAEGLDIPLFLGGEKLADQGRNTVTSWCKTRTALEVECEPCEPVLEETLRCQFAQLLASGLLDPPLRKLEEPVAELLDENDPDGAVIIREKGSSAPRLMMSREDYEDILKYAREKKDEP